MSYTAYEHSSRGKKTTDKILTKSIANTCANWGDFYLQIFLYSFILSWMVAAVWRIKVVLFLLDHPVGLFIVLMVLCCYYYSLIYPCLLLFPASMSIVASSIRLLCVIKDYLFPYLLTYTSYRCFMTCLVIDWRTMKRQEAAWQRDWTRQVDQPTPLSLSNTVYAADDTVASQHRCLCVHSMRRVTTCTALCATSIYSDTAVELLRYSVNV